MHTGWDDVMERELYIVAAPDFAHLPRSFSFPTPHFAALLAADTTETSDSTLTAFADTLLQSGCAYFCSWGPGCERVHDLFDAQCLSAPSLVMTTWHADEPLDEALGFSSAAPFPTMHISILVAVLSPSQLPIPIQPLTLSVDYAIYLRLPVMYSRRSNQAMQRTYPLFAPHFP